MPPTKTIENTLKEIKRILDCQEDDYLGILGLDENLTKYEINQACMEITNTCNPNATTVQTLISDKKLKNESIQKVLQKVGKARHTLLENLEQESLTKELSNNLGMEEDVVSLKSRKLLIKIKKRFEKWMPSFLKKIFINKNIKKTEFETDTYLEIPDIGTEDLKTALNKTEILKSNMVQHNIPTASEFIKETGGKRFRSSSLRNIDKQLEEFHSTDENKNLFESSLAKSNTLLRINQSIKNTLSTIPKKHTEEVRKLQNNALELMETYRKNLGLDIGPDKKEFVKYKEVFRI